eukprot:g73441.t1
MLAKQVRHWWAGAQIAFEARPSAAGAVSEGHKWVWSEWPGCAKWYDTKKGHIPAGVGLREPKNFALSLLSLWRWAPVVEHVYFWSSRGSGIYVVSGKVVVWWAWLSRRLKWSCTSVGLSSDPKQASYLSSL